MSDLEPCPFCGRAVGLLRSATWVRATCAFCEADGPTCDDDEDAIAAWNRRAPSADHIPDTGKMVAPPVVKDCLTTQGAYRAGAEAMREAAADKADAMADSWDADWRAERKASTHLEGKSDGAEEVAAAIRALPAGGSGWRDMTDKPMRPMPVLYWFGKRWWHQTDGTPAPLDPVRDPAERTEAGWWNGEEWCETGTGHDLFEPWREERDLPTRWQPLPAAPEEGG